MRCAPVILAALAVGAHLAAGPGMGQESPTPGAGISALGKMPPLDPVLAPGNNFDQAIATEITKIKSTNQWHQIPAWLAGSWESEQATVRSFKDQKSGTEDLRVRVYPEHSTDTHGDFTDQTGQVWAADVAMFRKGADNDAFVKYTLFLSFISIAATDTKYLYQIQSVDLYVYRKTNTIKVCCPWLTEIVERLVSPGVLSNKTTYRSFDLNGSLRSTAEVNSTLNRTSEAVPNQIQTTLYRTTLEGKPLYPQFVQFLKDHNMANRVPEGQPSGSKPMAKP
jgi:hypothetical protein